MTRTDELARLARLNQHIRTCRRNIALVDSALPTHAGTEEYGISVRVLSNLRDCLESFLKLRALMRFYVRKAATSCGTSLPRQPAVAAQGGLELYIQDCKRMIQEQCQRLARQVDCGGRPAESNIVLYCLQQSLFALEQARKVDEHTRRCSHSPSEVVRYAVGATPLLVPPEATFHPRT